MNEHTTFVPTQGALVCEVIEVITETDGKAPHAVAVERWPVVGWYVTQTEDGPETEAAVLDCNGDVLAFEYIVTPMANPGLLSARLTTQPEPAGERAWTFEERYTYESRIESKTRRAA